MTHVLSFHDESATSLAQTGGKGSNLARLTQARFPVPPGFVVATGAYAEFIAAGDLGTRITEILATIDYDDGAGVEARTLEIRALIEQAPMPDALGTAITTAYRGLGDGQAFVAVRSSGTAEDLAEASFAGQHDSFLDVQGEEDVLDAVRRCWASLWTARATAYRKQGGFDHAEVLLAVVVQEMIASEVSGVMFTANPMSTAVDEFVINAAYGLGEGIVSGILTPDQFTIDRSTYEVVDELIGEKAKRVVRDPEAGKNTIVEETPAAEREKPSLSPDQIRSLGRLGARVMEHHGDWPQDLEWGYADGTFHLLQSRDITGVDFSWDEDLEDYCPHLPRTDRSELHTRAFADAVWQGKVTPMGYSMRGEAFQPMIEISQRMWGTPEEITNMRIWKYHKGEVYYLSRQELENHLHFIPPSMRNPALLQWTPQTWLEDLQDKPGSLFNYVKCLARLRQFDPDNGPYRFFTHCERQMVEKADELMGPGPQELLEMSDAELRLAVDRAVSNQKEWVEDLWSGFFVHASTISTAFMWMLGNWYKGDNALIFSDLITGLPKPTITLKENLLMWEFAEQVRASETLTRLFEEHPGAEFFAVVAAREDEESRTFMETYRSFLKDFGHRGHADRDVSYLRRVEDPGLDYTSIKVFLTAEGEMPGSNEERLIAQREAATEEALASIRSQPLGSIKAEIFKLTHEWLLRFFVFRDDERHHTDRGTWAKKKSVEEVGRRLVERGVLNSNDDYLYLSKRELMTVFSGVTRNLRVVHAKIEARRRNCDAYRKESAPPMYILGNGTVTTEGAEAASGFSEDGVLRGVGTSRGEVVGTARVIPEQKDLHRVQRGDILVTHSTDPGWTTVFLILDGLVLETGGMLAHGSCISREYGIPAVQVNDAMSYIEDGSTISVNGDTGEVRILAGPGESVAEEPTPAGVA